MIWLAPAALAVSSTAIGEVHGDARALVATGLGVGLVDDEGWVVYERAGVASRTDGDYAALAWDADGWLTCGPDGLVSWRDGAPTVLEPSPCDAVAPHAVGGSGLAIGADGVFATWRGSAWDDPAGAAEALAADGWLAAAAGASLTVWSDRARVTYAFEAPVDAIGVDAGGPLWASGGHVGSTRSLDGWDAPDDVTAVVAADLDGVGDPTPYAIAGGQLWAVADGLALGDADLVAVGDVDGDGCDELITAADGVLRQWFDPACDAAGDRDHDGYTVFGGDCDDADPTSSPGAVEVCDGVDDDCDGEVDEPGVFLGGPRLTRGAEGVPFRYEVRWSGCEPAIPPTLTALDAVVCGPYDGDDFDCAVVDGGTGTLTFTQRHRDGGVERVMTPFEGIEVAPVLYQDHELLTFVSGVDATIHVGWTDPGFDTVVITTDTPWVTAPPPVEPDGMYVVAPLQVRPPAPGSFPVTVTLASDGVSTVFTLDVLVRMETLRRVEGEAPTGCAPRSPIGGLVAAVAVLALRRRRAPARRRRATTNPE